MKKPMSIYINLKISHIYFNAIESAYIESLIHEIEHILPQYTEKYYLKDIFVDCPYNILFSFHILERVVLSIEKSFSTYKEICFKKPFKYSTVDYLGFGLRSKSKVANVYITQTKNIREYITSPIGSRSIRKLSLFEEASLYFLHHISSGMDIREFGYIYGESIRKIFEEKLKKHEKSFSKTGYIYVLKDKSKKEEIYKYIL